MKILHTVETYNPIVSGMQEVVKQISERLAANGHEVYVATRKVPERGSKNINGVEIVDFNISGNFVRGLTGDVEKYKEFLLTNKFDVITNFAAQQWATDIMLPVLDQIDAVKVFVPTGFSGFYEPSYTTYFELMKNWIHKYDMNFFLSDNYRDVNFAKDNGVEKRMLVPNGADEREFLKESKLSIREQLNIPEDYFLVFHVGSHTGQKGHREAIEIFEKANIKKAAFIICGNSHGGGCTGSCELKTKEFNENKKNLSDEKMLINTFLTRDQTVEAYKQSDVFLFPSNIECSPITLFECMAAKLPYLVTDVGNSKEITEWSNGGVVLKTQIDSTTGYSLVDIDSAASNLEDLFSSKEIRKSYGENGHNAWKEKFMWKEIADTYEKTYEKLIAEKDTKDSNKKHVYVDIVLLTYNTAEYIEEVFAKLNSQVIKPRNIIVADYGSTDNTLDVIKGVKSEIPVKFIEASDIVEARNKSIELVSSPYFIYINDKSITDSFFILDFVNEMNTTNLKNVGLVYQNFNAMESNKSQVNRFSIFELDMSIRGYVFNELLRQNKILSTINNCLISKEIINNVGEFDSKLDVMHEWDMIVRISKVSELDYCLKYGTLVDNPLYKSLVHYDHEFLSSNLRFYNKWYKDADTSIRSTWANHIAWRTLLIYPNLEFVKVVNNTASKSAKSSLFKKSLGSFKLYLILYVGFRFLKGFIDLTVAHFNNVATFIKTAFNIIRV